VKTSDYLQFREFIQDIKRFTQYNLFVIERAPSRYIQSPWYLHQRGVMLVGDTLGMNATTFSPHRKTLELVSNNRTVQEESL
jgi:hypothetical protein